MIVRKQGHFPIALRTPSPAIVPNTPLYGTNRGGWKKLSRSYSQCCESGFASTVRIWIWIDLQIFHNLTSETLLNLCFTIATFLLYFFILDYTIPVMIIPQKHDCYTKCLLMYGTAFFCGIQHFVGAYKRWSCTVISRCSKINDCIKKKKKVAWIPFIGLVESQRRLRLFNNFSWTIGSQ